MRRMALVLFAASAALAGGWTGPGCSAPGEARTGDGRGGGGRPPVAVEVEPAVTGDVTDAIEVVGSLAPKFEAEVKSEYAGIVAQVAVNEWVRVAKGDPLAKLDTREADRVLQKARAALEAARAALLHAEVSGTRAGRELGRFVNLAESGLATRQDLDDARSAKEAAEAAVAAALAQLHAAEEDVRHAETRLAKTVIRSPIDGVVAHRGVNVGDLVGEMGSPKAMFRIVDNRLLNLTVSVPSTEMAAVGVGQPLAFETDALPGRTFAGTVMFVNPSVDEADRSVKVIAEVPNESGDLKGGLFVKGRIVTGSRAGVVQVPRAALVAWDMTGKQGEVFVVEGEVAHRRAIRTGSAAGEGVEVVSGLAAGERVVTRGGFQVRDGDRLLVAAGEGGRAGEDR